jgi:ubiquinone/menaquinone biosynthesis C-methylase UbiE
MPNAAHQWTQFYTGNAEMMYPAEAVIRIFKGSYPNLKMSKPKRGDKILDVGCGDGRHFELFSDLGMELAGTEITQDIVNSVAENLSAVGEIGIHPDLRVGTCAKLSWPNDSFNYLLTWNSCYYMGPDGKFEDHVAEMARVIKPGGSCARCRSRVASSSKASTPSSQLTAMSLSSTTTSASATASGCGSSEVLANLRSPSSLTSPTSAMPTSTSTCSAWRITGTSS